MRSPQDYFLAALAPNCESTRKSQFYRHKPQLFRISACPNRPNLLLKPAGGKQGDLSIGRSYFRVRPLSFLLIPLAFYV